MINEEIYEVSRTDYLNALKTIKKEVRDIKVIKDGDFIYNEVYSKTTGELLVSRKTYIGQDFKISETYYLWSLPIAEDSVPPQPTFNLVLETKEEVQAFLQAMQEVNNNYGRTL